MRKTQSEAAEFKEWVSILRNTFNSYIPGIILLLVGWSFQLPRIFPFSSRKLPGLFTGHAPYQRVGSETIGHITGRVRWGRVRRFSFFSLIGSDDRYPTRSGPRGVTGYVIPQIRV